MNVFNWAAALSLAGALGFASPAIAQVAVTDAWVRGTVTGQMATARAAHVAILLANGAVLVAGPDLPAELYDTTSGSFTRTGGLIAVRKYAAAVLLQDGRVLVTGGYDSNTAELYK